MAVLLLIYGLAAPLGKEGTCNFKQDLLFKLPALVSMTAKCITGDLMWSFWSVCSNQVVNAGDSSPLSQLEGRRHS